MIELTGKYTNAIIYADTIEEGVFGQVYDIINCAAFAGQRVVCMPDVHVGASGPCGLVATIGDWVCPEHIGVDIGCSVSMLVLDGKVPADKYAEFERRIKNKIPFGFNINAKTIIDEKDFYRFLSDGFNKYRNYWPEMLADLPDKVTEKWVTKQLSRLGMDEGMFYKSLGTVGGGNHFIEYDESTDSDMAGVTLHFGSRNFGVKVCKYWMKKANAGVSRSEMKALQDAFKEEYKKSGKDMVNFIDDWKAYADSINAKSIKGYLSGEQMKGYLCDMCFAQLYAQYNHATVQKTIKDLLLKYGIKVKEVITSVHNFIDLKDHILRKSSIRSYAGEKMLVPFNMRDGVAVCEGKSNDAWLNSCSHGAGRKMSRSAAKKNVSLDEFKESMEGIYSTSVCAGTLDESPMAYKDTDEIKSLITETCDIKFMLVPKISIKSTDEVD
jgi:RNA-splicing ligase RtcB